MYKWVSLDEKRSCYCCLCNGAFLLVDLVGFVVVGSLHLLLEAKINNTEYFFFLPSEKEKELQNRIELNADGNAFKKWLAHRLAFEQFIFRWQHWNIGEKKMKQATHFQLWFGADIAKSGLLILSLWKANLCMKYIGVERTHSYVLWVIIRSKSGFYDRNSTRMDDNWLMLTNDIGLMASKSSAWKVIWDHSSSMRFNFKIEDHPKTKHPVGIQDNPWRHELII